MFEVTLPIKNVLLRNKGMKRWLVATSYSYRNLSLEDYSVLSRGGEGVEKVAGGEGRTEWAQLAEQGIQIV